MLPSVSEILAQTLVVYRRNMRYFLRYMALFFIITFVLKFLRDAILASRLISLPGVAFVIFVLSIIVIGIITLWLHLGLMVAVKQAIDGSRADRFQDIMQRVWPFLPRAVGVAILSGLLVGLGSLFLVIPGLILLVWYAFSTHEVVFYNCSVGQALEESKRLAVGRWFSVAWRLFVPTFVFAISASIIEIIALIPFSWPHIFNPPLTLPTLLANALIIAILYAIVFPMIITSIMILFFKLKEFPLAPPAPAENLSPSES
jgi:hypothetical protein